MIEHTGKYSYAKIFANLVEDSALEQIYTLTDQPYTKGSKIRIMPDVHAGSGCTIGTTMTVHDKICPSLVGVDISCGVYVLELGNHDIDFDVLDRIIRHYIPSGFNIHDEPLSYSNIETVKEQLMQLKCLKSIDFDRAINSIGTLGGGNHFIEVDEDEDGYKYLVIHSGSRNLGKCVAEYYQKLALDEWKNEHNDITKEIIALMKDRNHPEYISESLKIWKDIDPEPLKDLAYLKGQHLLDYINDAFRCSRYAYVNRVNIAREICEHMHWYHTGNRFESVHNYIDVSFDDKIILRKGAVSAYKGDKLIIPLNMRDGSLICTGKGNPDWNYSAPHGAGRVMSRMGAKREVPLEMFKKSMEGIYSTCVNEDTLDECPFAYKPAEYITDFIDDTVKIEKVIKPIYNFKAS